METRTRTFSLLFSVTIAHGWFGEAPCPYLSLEPDTDCRRLLGRKRQIWKRTDTGLQVIGETAHREEAPGQRKKSVPEPEEGDHYRFLIRLEDTAFFDVTKLDCTDFPARLFCFSNTPKSNRLTAKKYQNPGRNEEAILGMIDISLAGYQPATGAREPFLLSFEAPASFRS